MGKLRIVNILSGLALHFLIVLLLYGNTSVVPLTIPVQRPPTLRLRGAPPVNRPPLAMNRPPLALHPPAALSQPVRSPTRSPSAERGSAPHRSSETESIATMSSMRVQASRSRSRSPDSLNQWSDSIADLDYESVASTYYIDPRLANRGPKPDPQPIRERRQPEMGPNWSNIHPSNILESHRFYRNE